MQVCTSEYSTQLQMEFVLFLSLLRVDLYAFVSVIYDYLMVITLYNYYIIMYFFYSNFTD